MRFDILYQAYDRDFGGACREANFWIVIAQPVFPRLNVRDLFKGLGVSRDASEEEFREARNYLSSQVNYRLSHDYSELFVTSIPLTGICYFYEGCYEAEI